MAKLSKLSTLLNLQDKQVRRYWSTLISAAEYQASRLMEVGLRPDIIVAGLPIYTVQKEGHAASDEILKYRSIGGIFLAHQKGGNRTFKFDALIYGPSRLLILGALQQLLRHGRQVGLPLTEVLIQEDAGDYSAQDIAIRQNAIGGYIDNEAQKESTYVPYHRTFPIITDSKIYMNMYLETLVSREDVRLGQNCIEIRCAFREYMPPTNVDYTLVKVDKKEKIYYETWIDPEQRIRMKRNDLAINLMWAARSVVQYYLDKELQEKERNKYLIEAGILAATCVPFFSYGV